MFLRDLVSVVKLDREFSKGAGTKELIMNTDKFSVLICEMGIIIGPSK